MGFTQLAQVSPIIVWLMSEPGVAATVAAAVATGIGALATFASAVVIGIQAVHTRRSAEAALRAANASEAAVSVSQRGLRLASEESARSAAMVAESIKARLDATAARVSVRRIESHDGPQFLRSASPSRPIESFVPMDSGVTFNYPTDKDESVWLRVDVIIKNEGTSEVRLDFFPPFIPASTPQSWERGLGTVHLSPNQSTMGTIAVGGTVDQFVNVLRHVRSFREYTPYVFASSQWHIPTPFNTGVVQLQRFELMGSLIEPTQKEGLWRLRTFGPDVKEHPDLKQRPILRTYILDSEHEVELEDKPSVHAASHEIAEPS